MSGGSSASITRSESSSTLGSHGMNARAIPAMTRRIGGGSRKRSAIQATAATTAMSAAAV